MLQTPGNLLERIRAWSTQSGASVTHGAGNRHLNQRILKRLRTWELQMLRSMLKMRRRPHENQKAYNQRTAAQIYNWFGKAGTLLSYHWVPRIVYRSAWREKYGPSIGLKEHPL